MDLDYSKIKFPSDNITIGMMRKLHPKEFDAEWWSCTGVFGHRAPASTGQSQTSIDMNEMLYGERAVAERGWVKASRVTLDPAWLEEVNGGAEPLPKLYIKYGLARGPQHAEQLIRNIESQAAALAKQLPGH